jgi:hypothetical protein
MIYGINTSSSSSMDPQPATSFVMNSGDMIFAQFVRPNVVKVVSPRSYGDYLNYFHQSRTKNRALDM